MSAIELAPKNAPLRLPSHHVSYPAASNIEHESPDLEFASTRAERVNVAVVGSGPIADPIPFPSPRLKEEDEEMPLACEQEPSRAPLSPPEPSILSFPSPPLSKRGRVAPLIIPSAGRSPSPPPTPSPTRPSHKRRHSQDEAVMKISQLVASLTLRYRDRAATRPRSRSPKNIGEEGEVPKSSSPLSRVVVVPQAVLEPSTPPVAF